MCIDFHNGSGAVSDGIIHDHGFRYSIIGTGPTDGQCIFPTSNGLRFDGNHLVKVATESVIYLPSGIIEIGIGQDERITWMTSQSKVMA